MRSGKLGLTKAALLALHALVVVGSNGTFSTVLPTTERAHDVFSIIIIPTPSTLPSSSPQTVTTSLDTANIHSPENSAKRRELLILYLSVSVAALCVLVVLLLAFSFCREERIRRRKLRVTDTREIRNESEDRPAVLRFARLPGEQRLDPEAVEYFPLEPLESPAPLLQRDIWEIPMQRLQIGNKLGQGAFGFVFKAVLTTGDDSSETKVVAVKTVKEDASLSDRDDLLAELKIMKQLKPHPNVVSLIGAVRNEVNCPLVVVEFVPFGDLLGYLRKGRGLEDLCYFDSDNLPTFKPSTSLELMKFAIECAQGMEYLSKKKIVHRDLAARNVLVGTGRTCKITDFGMARNVRQSEIYMRSTRGLIPVKWTAIESILRGIYTTRSDVWSFGVLLFEILTVGGTPYPGMNGHQVREFISEGKRLPKPLHVDNELYQVMMDCWQSNPRKRPTFNKLVYTLKRLEPCHQEYINLSKYNSGVYENIESFEEEV